MASRIYLALILVFIAAAGTRLAFLHFAASGTFSNPDTAGYQGLADSLLSNWTYATDKAAGAPGGFPADLQRPPGYPFFLYLISPWSGVNRGWVAFVQSMLGGVFAVFLAVMAPRPIVCLFVIAVLLALLPSASPVGYSRFRVHAVPSLCFLAAIGAWRASLWRGRRLSG